MVGATALVGTRGSPGVDATAAASAADERLFA
jgi:hypothetical protein